MSAARATSPATAPHAPSPQLLRLGLGLSLLLMLIALGVFVLSLRAVQNSAEAGTEISITATGCQPESVEVPAGQHTFTIVNRSDRAIEWEIIDGVMVLAERENITPGLRQPLNVDLAPGQYAMTCGLLSNPHGQLHVLPGNEADQPQALAARDFIAPLAEYRVYVTLQVRQLTRQVNALQQAIDAGDLDAARTAYLEARRTDQRLAMPTGLFSDLDQQLNARADDFTRRDADPAFRGFQRLALALFEHQTLNDLSPVADRLVADVDALSARLSQASIPPAQLADGSARVLQAWHDHQADANTLTPLALNDLTGLVEGSAKVISLMRPLLEHQAPRIEERLDRDLTALQQALTEADPPRSDEVADGDETPDVINAAPVPAATAQRLVERSEALAGSLAAVNRALALSG